jgi:hypothetical protein
MLSGWIPRLTHGDNVGFSRKRTLALAVAIALDVLCGRGRGWRSVSRR